MKFTKAAAALCALTMVLGAAAPVSGGVLGFDTAINASAADKPTSGKCGENVNWSLSSDGTLTISGTGETYDYEGGILSDKPSPWDMDGRIKSVVVKSGITKIGKALFFNMESLTTVSLPSTVTDIGANAFDCCVKLSQINIPNSVTRIQSNTFYKTGLKTITLPDSVTLLGDNVFGRSSLESIVIPNSVTQMGESVFEYCGSLKSVTLPNKITAIPKSCFYVDESLERITIPGNIKVINVNAFGYCKKLTEVVMSDGVADIRSGSFMECPNLKYVTIPKSVTTISDPRFPSGVTIRCYRGTPAETFAKSKNYKIEYLDGTGTVKYGDVNKDGNVNDADVGLLQQYLADWKVTIDTAAADVTGDGKVNESDIGLLQQFLADWKVTLGK